MLRVKYGEVFRLGKQNPSHTLSHSRFILLLFNSQDTVCFFPYFVPLLPNLTLVGLNKFSPHLTSLNKCTYMIPLIPGFSIPIFLFSCILLPKSESKFTYHKFTMNISTGQHALDAVRRLAGAQAAGGGPHRGPRLQVPHQGGERAGRRLAHRRPRAGRHGKGNKELDEMMNR